VGFGILSAGLAPREQPFAPLGEHHPALGALALQPSSLAKRVAEPWRLPTARTPRLRNLRGAPFEAVRCSRSGPQLRAVHLYLVGIAHRGNPSNTRIAPIVAATPTRAVG